MFQTEVVEKTETSVLCSIYFLCKPYDVGDNEIKLTFIVSYRNSKAGQLILPPAVPLVLRCL
jgi:hypothetical protein